MKKNMVLKIWSRAKLCMLFLAAIALCWRGSTFSDPTGLSLIPVLMCLLMALSLGMVGLTMATKSHDPLFI